MSRLQNPATMYGSSPWNKQVVQSPHPGDIGKFTEQVVKKKNAVKRGKSIRNAVQWVNQAEGLVWFAALVCYWSATGKCRSLPSWSWALGMLVASVSSGSACASIRSTSSFILAVSSSSMGTRGSCTVAVGLGKGIWPGSLIGEFLGTPKIYRAANHPASKSILRAWFTTGSTEFLASANPSLYHFSSQASKATLRSASSLAWAVFRLISSASLTSVSFCLAKSFAGLFFANALFLSVAAAFFSAVLVAFVFSLVVLVAVSRASLSWSASSARSFARPPKMLASWAA